MKGVLASEPRVFLCVVTGRDGKAANEESRLDAVQAVRKSYRPCYADQYVTVFSTNDDLPAVARRLNEICSDFDVGNLVLEIDANRISTHKASMSKCFGSSSVDVHVEIKKAGLTHGPREREHSGGSG